MPWHPHWLIVRGTPSPEAWLAWCSALLRLWAMPKPRGPTSAWCGQHIHLLPRPEGRDDEHHHQAGHHEHRLRGRPQREGPQDCRRHLDGCDTKLTRAAANRPSGGTRTRAHPDFHRLDSQPCPAQTVAEVDVWLCKFSPIDAPCARPFRLVSKWSGTGPLVLLWCSVES